MVILIFERNTSYIISELKSVCKSIRLKLHTTRKKLKHVY